MTTTEYSAFRAEVARRSNKARGVPEAIQSQIKGLYFEGGLTAQEVAARLGVSKGSVRATINKAYAAMTPEEHARRKRHHGSVVRRGARNGNARPELESL